jgi:hypothetical protein
MVPEEGEPQAQIPQQARTVNVLIDICGIAAVGADLG